MLTIKILFTIASSPKPDGKQDGGRFVRHIAFDMFT